MVCNLVLIYSFLLDPQSSAYITIKNSTHTRNKHAKFLTGDEKPHHRNHIIYFEQKYEPLNLKLKNITFSKRHFHHRYEYMKLSHNKTSGPHGVNKRSPVNDVVSRNITMVLENLLKNYESSQLPTHGKGKFLVLNLPGTILTYFFQ